MRHWRRLGDAGRSSQERHADMDFVFEWDEEKASRNKAKHGITFEEAKTVFNDPFSMTVSDPDHSDAEERWVDIGLSAEGKLLVVWYAERGERIRIIGSRKATRAEERTYVNERI
jgi:uncharacterized protein